MAKTYRWTYAEKQFLRTSFPTMPKSKIASQLDRTVGSINNQAWRMELKRLQPYNRRWTLEEEKYLTENNGILFYDEMSLDRTPTAVAKHAEVMGLKPYGMRCPTCKVNPKSYTSKMCSRCGIRKHLSALGKGRYFLKRDGYIEMSISAIPEEDWQLVYPMVTKGQKVLEHRYLMAKHLGRPLDRKEVVHHRNGDRADNNIENLQLFRIGKHHRGHGNYYHEWQMALIEIQRLTEILDGHRVCK